MASNRKTKPSKTELIEEINKQIAEKILVALIFLIEQDTCPIALMHTKEDLIKAGHNCESCEQYPRFTEDIVKAIMQKSIDMVKDVYFTVPKSYRYDPLNIEMNVPDETVTDIINKNRDIDLSGCTVEINNWEGVMDDVSEYDLKCLLKKFTNYKLHFDG